jgi:hypothetical protein
MLLNKAFRVLHDYHNLYTHIPLRIKILQIVIEFLKIWTQKVLNLHIALFRVLISPLQMRIKSGC